ncbi:S1 family peptidase [Streptomyces xiamenensis]|uniref:S1 family peptidase n=1 Tax=Streptomyces xiamenensis TaxID=408015 RepID=UPI0036C62364
MSYVRLPLFLTPQEAAMRLLRYGTALLALLTAVSLLIATPAVAAGPTVRGGDRVYSSSGGSCAIGFNAHGGGTQRYGLLPGGCGGTGTTWYADSALTVPIGTTAASSFPGGGWALIQYNATVNAPGEISIGGAGYPITGAASPVVGGRVCLATPTSGTRCGTVTAVNLTINAGSGAYTGVFAANLCVEAGTAPGTPSFSGSTGVGVLIGSSGNCATGGTSYHLPVVQALNSFGLSLV